MLATLLKEDTLSSSIGEKGWPPFFTLHLEGLNPSQSGLRIAEAFHRTMDTTSS